MMVEGVPANGVFAMDYPTVVGEHEKVAFNFGDETFDVDMVTVECNGKKLQVDVSSVKPAPKGAKTTVIQHDYQ